MSVGAEALGEAFVTLEVMECSALDAGAWWVSEGFQNDSSCLAGAWLQQSSIPGREGALVCLLVCMVFLLLLPFQENNLLF